MRYEEIENKPREYWERQIEQWIHNETDRAMLVRRLLDGLTYEELAAEFGFSTVHTKNRINKAKNKLFKHSL